MRSWRAFFEAFAWALGGACGAILVYLVLRVLEA